MVHQLQELRSLQETNRKNYQDLQKEGLDINLSAARVDLFIEHVLPWNDGTNADRLDFELTWERKVSELLINIKSQVFQAKLTQGVSVQVPQVPQEEQRGLRVVSDGN